MSADPMQGPPLATLDTAAVADVVRKALWSRCTRFYIDPKTASVVSQYNARGWVSRWL